MNNTSEPVLRAECASGNIRMCKMRMNEPGMKAFWQRKLAYWERQHEIVCADRLNRSASPKQTRP